MAQKFYEDSQNKKDLFQRSYEANERQNNRLASTLPKVHTTYETYSSKPVSNMSPLLCLNMTVMSYSSWRIQVCSLALSKRTAYANLPK